MASEVVAQVDIQSNGIGFLGLQRRAEVFLASRGCRYFVHRAGCQIVRSGYLVARIVEQRILFASARISSIGFVLDSSVSIDRYAEQVSWSMIRWMNEVDTNQSDVKFWNAY